MAWSSTPSRGDTWYLKDGSYGGRTFNTANSGTTTITILKAIGATGQSGHGTDTGWNQSTMGSSQAAITDLLTFSSSYWTISGQTGNGFSTSPPDETPANYGIMMNNGANCVELTPSITTITFSHIYAPANTNTPADAGNGWFIHNANVSGTVSNITVSYCLLTGWGQAIRAGEGSGQNWYNLLWQYNCYRSIYTSESLGYHGNPINAMWSPIYYLTCRYSLFRTTTGDGGLSEVISANGDSIIGAKIYGCVFDQMWSGRAIIAGNCVTSAGSVQNSVIYNNTFLLSSYGEPAGQPGGGLAGDECSSGNIFQNNLAYYCNGAVNGGVTDDYNEFIYTTSTPSESHGIVISGNYNPFTSNASEVYTLLTNTPAGTALTAEYQTDALGNTRTTWTRGAFEYSTGVVSTNPVIQVSPATLNFGSLAVGASATNTVTVQNAGGGTLAGTATAAAPFAIASGGSYSLGSGQSQTVGVCYRPTANGSNSANVTFTGGGGSVVAVSGSARSLTGIALSPANPSILTGVSQQFTAEGTYSDGSQQDLTSSASWSSSETSVATISAGGLATGVATGTTTISATLAGVSGNTVLTVQTAPLAITTTALANAALNTPYTAALAASGGMGPYSWSIASGSLPAGLTLNASSGTIAGTPTAGGTFSITVQVSDAASPADTATKALSLVVSSLVTIWPSSATPTTADEGDTSGSAVELGVKFRSDAAGTVMGIRFYKCSANTGTHIGNLWSTNGTLLGSVTFTNETASGWQQMLFAAPATINSNTVYVASYHTTNGHYSEDDNYFASSGVDNAPLHALANGVSGSNEVYVYSSSSSYPNQSWNSANYWVDIVFQPAVAPAGQPPLSPTNLHVVTSN